MGRARLLPPRSATAPSGQADRAEHDGRFPRDPAVARRLPGIGRYTAGAILSIAFDAREPILEANTIRLFSRLLAFRGDPATAGQKQLWAFGADILPRKNVGQFNQALMELGSGLCVPRQPRCVRAQSPSLSELARQDSRR